LLAEGVETAAELEFLGHESCSEAQGYFLSRPQPIASFRQATHGEPCVEIEGDFPKIQVG
jgi:EAL domain-containing protein (putative c-di-GMP-specific phosphodiesterase class I)